MALLVKTGKKERKEREKSINSLQFSCNQIQKTCVFPSFGFSLYVVSTLW